MELTLDPASALARLAAGVIVADGRVTTAELMSADVLDQLGLGPMRQRLLAELERARTEGLDLEPAVAAVSRLSPRARAVIFEVLAELAAADGELSNQEALLLDKLATRWDLEVPPPWQKPTAPGPQAHASADSKGVRVPVKTGDRSPAAAESEADRASVTPAGNGLSPEAESALAVLGLPSDASPDAVDEAFRALVHRYNPAHVIDLGPEFALLAIRRLSRIADAYVTWKRRQKSAPMG